MFLPKDFEESKAITYAIAKSKTPKLGCCVITPVLWDGVEVKRDKITLKTIGETMVVSPPVLVRGYEMIMHDDTIDLLVSIYDGRCSYPPEYVDKAFSDIEKLVKLEYIPSMYLDCISFGINDKETISFLQDEDNPNIKAYDEWYGKLSSAWLELMIEAGFLEAHNCTGMCGEIFEVFGRAYKHSFNISFGLPEGGKFLSKDDFLEDCYMESPPKRLPTQDDLSLFRSALIELIQSKISDLQKALSMVISKSDGI